LLLGAETTSEPLPEGATRGNGSKKILLGGKIKARRGTHSVKDKCKERSGQKRRFVAQEGGKVKRVYLKGEAGETVAEDLAGEGIDFLLHLVKA